MWVSRGAGLLLQHQVCQWQLSDLVLRRSHRVMSMHSQELLLAVSWSIYQSRVSIPSNPKEPLITSLFTSKLLEWEWMFLTQFNNIIKSLIQLPNSLQNIERVQNNVTFLDYFCLEKTFYTDVLNEGSNITGTVLVLFSRWGGTNGTTNRLI